MLYIISAILIIIGLIKKESKLLFYVAWLLLLILFLGGNTENHDRVIYMANYMDLAKGLHSANFEFGFQTLCKIGSALGLSYNQFLFVITFIAFALIANTIKQYTSDISYVLMLYFIYPFIWDTVQIRNFLVLAIIIYASRYIISYKKQYIKYIICVLIASSIHITALFYLSLLLLAIKNSRKMYTLVGVVTATSVLFMPLIIKLSKLFISVGKINAYTMSQTSMFTKFAVIIYCLTSIILVVIAKKILAKEDQEENNLKKTYTKFTFKIKEGRLRFFQEQREIIKLDAEAVFKINIICMLSLYFIMNSLHFFRLYRNIFVINYILFALALSKMDKNKKYYQLFWGVFIFVILSFLFLILYVPTTNIFYPVFSHNVFLK